MLTIKKKHNIYECIAPKNTTYTYIPGHNFKYYELPSLPNKIFNCETKCICIYSKDKTIPLERNVSSSIFAGIQHNIHIIKLRRYIFFFPKSNFTFNLYHYGIHIGISHDNMVLEIDAEYKYEKKQLTKKKKIKNKTLPIVAILFFLFLFYLIYFR